MSACWYERALVRRGGVRRHDGDVRARPPQRERPLDDLLDGTCRRAAEGGDGARHRRVVVWRLTDDQWLAQPVAAEGRVGDAQAAQRAARIVGRMDLEPAR